MKAAERVDPIAFYVTLLGFLVIVALQFVDGISLEAAALLVLLSFIPSVILGYALVRRLGWWR